MAQDKNDPEAVKPTREADIQRAGLTIPQFMAKRGIEGGVRLEGDEGRVSSVEGEMQGERPREPGSSSRASDILTDDKGRKYSMGGIVAKGGMGAILRARDLNIRRTVAMKVMLDPNTVSEAQVLRFIEEAQVTGQLEHPGIVPVHELGVDAGDNVFYTMKFVQGANLRDILKGIAEGQDEVIARYPLSRLLNVFLKVCDAVAFAHTKGVVHRDLKPENIMVGDYGEVMVMDWGLAKVLGARSAEHGGGDEEVSGVRCQVSGKAGAAKDGRAPEDEVSGDNMSPVPGSSYEETVLAHRPE